MARMVLLVGLALLLSASASQAIIVEAESYVDRYNAGGDTIYVVPCSGASGGFAVEGFDAVGDWIEVVLDAPETYIYTDSLRSAGYLNYESYLKSTIFGASPDGGDVTSTYHTLGKGIG